jgi:hypothetical protein
MTLGLLTVFWDATPCSLVEIYSCFGVTNCPHLQGKIDWFFYQTARCHARKYGIVIFSRWYGLVDHRCCIWQLVARYAHQIYSPSLCSSITGQVVCVKWLVRWYWALDKLRVYSRTTTVMLARDPWPWNRRVWSLYNSSEPGIVCLSICLVFPWKPNKGLLR